RMYVHLKPKIYHFKVKNYTGSEVYNGFIRLRIQDIGEVFFNENVEKNKLTKIDLSNIIEKEYDVRIYVSSSNPVNGFIEKPMFVEGDYPVLWSYPTITIEQYNELLQRVTTLEGGG